MPIPVISVEHLFNRHDLGGIGTGTINRELQHLVGFGISLLMYVTQVLYPISSIPKNWRWNAVINPITPIIDNFRTSFLGAGDATFLGLGYSECFMLVVMFSGVVMFNRVKRTFIDTVFKVREEA